MNSDSSGHGPTPNDTASNSRSAAVSASVSDASAELEAIRTMRQQAAMLLDAINASARDAAREAAANKKQTAAHREEVNQLSKTINALRDELTIAARAARMSIEQTRLDTEKIVQSHARTAIEQVEARLAEAVRQGDALRDESISLAAELGRRVGETRHKLQAAIQDAHQASETTARRSAEGLNEYRTLLEQMNDRAGVIRADLVRLADTVQDHARKATDVQKQTAAAILQRLASMRDGVREEATQHHDRLLAARKEADHAIADLQRAAGALLARAQETAARLNDKADTLLTDARSITEAAVARAEAAMRNAEKLAATIAEEVRTIQHRTAKESELAREQIHAARLQMIESRDETARAGKELRDLQEKAHAQTQELLRRAEEVGSRTESILALPGEQIAEAGRRAAELAQLSRKTSEIIARLADAGKQVDARMNDSVNRFEEKIAAIDEKISAVTGRIDQKIAKVDEQVEQARRSVEQAAGEADQRIEVLQQQTSRVGQLVGIVRQLYGSLDARARIQQIRSRLEQADELCRGVVPREMEQLRAVIAEQLETPATPRLPTKHVAQPAPRSNATSKPHPPTRGRQPTVPSTPGADADMGAKVSLGDIVARNKKLNEWLKQTLNESGESQKPRPIDRREVDAPAVPRKPDAVSS